MKHFQLVHAGLDTAPLLADLAKQPQLWDLFHERRTSPGSPHVNMEDIWVRTRARDDLASPEAFKEPYYPVFYPAWHMLPAVQPIVHALMALTKAVQLGNILITRIPAYSSILPHTDTGWSPAWFGTKFYVVLQTNARCVNVCMDEEVSMRAGETWTFENMKEHSVDNLGATERISLIVTMRCEA